MRKKHLQEDHSSDPPQAGVDARDLDDDGVYPLLHYLVTKNRVEDVRRILSTLSNPETYKTHHFRLLASFEASPAMLQMFGECSSEREENDCIFQSMKSRNTTTMEYNLTLLTRRRPPHVDHNTQVDILRRLVAFGWLEGLKLWSVRFLALLEEPKPGYFGHKGLISVLNHLLDSSLFCAHAVKHPNGEQTLLFLWKDSGLLSYMHDPHLSIWASQQLRYVAKFGCSISLAEELLRRGARIDFQPRENCGTALHCAAGNTSAMGAEMMRFLLLKGANPEATRVSHPATRVSHQGLPTNVAKQKRIRDEKGAKCLQKWLGKSWDDLLEETKHIRNEKQVGESFNPVKTEGTLQH